MILLSGCVSAPSKGGTTAVGQEQEPDEPPEPEAMEVSKLSYALRGSEDDFRKCLMQAISARGKVETQFRVTTAGDVVGARVLSSSLHNESAESCLIRELMEQRLGPQATETVNRYTFVFRLTDPLTQKERKARLRKADSNTESALAVLPASQGTIDLAHIADIAQARYPLYAHCYRDSIRRRGESRGLVRFTLHIDEGGRVAEVKDDGSVLPDPYAVDCVAEAFYLMRFDPPQGPDAVVRYSLELQ